MRSLRASAAGGAALQRRLHFGHLARRRRPVALQLGRLQRLRQQEREQVAHPLRPHGFFQPFGHDRQGGRMQRLHVGAADAIFPPLRVAYYQIVALGARHAGQNAAVLHLDEASEIIGMDRGAWKADVAPDGLVIAVDQVRQVGADAAAAAVDLMALRALGLVAEEDRAAARPVAALQLGDFPVGVQRGVGRPRQGRPGQEQPMQRQRPRPVVLIRRISDVEVRILAGLQRDFQRVSARPSSAAFSG